MKIKDLLNTNDIFIFNLETVLADNIKQCNKIPKLKRLNIILSRFHLRKPLAK